MIFRSDASSDRFRAHVGKARVLGLAVLIAGLGGCAISMPIPGLMDKESTGSIAPKPAGIAANSPTAKPVAPAAMRAEAPAGQAALAGPEAAEN
jgi:hypothetical protein